MVWLILTTMEINQLDEFDLVNPQARLDQMVGAQVDLLTKVLVKQVTDLICPPLITFVLWVILRALFSTMSCR